MKEKSAISRGPNTYGSRSSELDGRRVVSIEGSRYDGLLWMRVILNYYWRVLKKLVQFCVRRKSLRVLLYVPLRIVKLSEGMRMQYDQSLLQRLM